MVDNKLLLWFGMMFPLMFSAGPANVTMASLGAQFGLIRSIPFICGINLIVLLHALLIGFGAGTFLEKYPEIFTYLKYAGSVYLIYLAFKFYRSSRPEVKAVAESVPHFFDGVILQMLNMKVVTLTMVMFSQFLDTGTARMPQVIMLSFGLASLTSGATITWAAGGAWLTRKFASEASVRLQGYVFGSMLVGVSVWMLV